MGAQRTFARHAAPAERRPMPQPAAVRASVAPSTVHRSHLLQQRLGNSGSQAFLSRQAILHDSPVRVQTSSLSVSSPNDPAEREATSVAAHVMRMPETAAPPGVGATGSSGIHRSAAAASPAPAAATATPMLSRDIPQSMSAGSPLPDSVRGFMEPRFDADFSRVRVHTGEPAARMSEGVNANAFTVGSHIFFGQGQYQPNSAKGQELIAHELTHVVQQGGATKSAGAGAVASISNSSSAPKVQRQEKKGLFDELTDDLLDFGESAGWELVREFAPSLEPLMRSGPAGLLDWLKDKVVGAAEALFDKVTAPVRFISGLGTQLSAQFAPLVATVQQAAGQIARNDCTPLREAADKIEKTATKIIEPIVAKLQPAVKKIQDVLDLLWNKIGAPVWDFIKEFAAAQWEAIQWLWGGIKAVASWIWGKTAAFRTLASKAWTWIKNKLGIGEGPEGEDGLLQWVQRKLSDAWDVVKAKIEPFKKELLTIGATIGGVLLAVSPVGPIAAVGAAVYGAVQGLRWIQANWGKGNIIVTARQYIEKALIPPLVAGANRIAASVNRFAGTVIDTLGRLSASLLRAAGALGNSVLRIAVGAIQWIADQVTAIANWATDKLDGLAQWLEGALGKLQSFLTGVMVFLQKVGNAILDIWSLPVLLGEKLWDKMPACIRDPVVDFIGPIILQQIEIFQELVKNDEAWQKTKLEVRKIIKLVFKDRDLMGAVKATFLLILRVFNLPPDLLVQVWNKALAAWDVVSKKPLEFLKSTVRTMGHGFKLYGKNILVHLEFGLTEWLLGGLKEQQIRPPKSWFDPLAVLDFVLDVLNLNVNHLWELVEKRFDPKQVAAVRSFFSGISRAWDWVKKAIDTSKTPAENTRGLIEKAKDFGKSILKDVATWIAGRVAQELAIMAAAAAASAGLSEVLDIARRIYKGIVSAVRWARQILDMISQTLDNILAIAGGQIESMGEKFEGILHRGTPVVIGFLADQVGLGGVGAEVRNIVKKLREQVDKAILWVIDIIKAGLSAIVNLAKAGVAAVKDWWKARAKVTFTGGEQHDVYFTGTEDNAEIIVESTPKTLSAFLAEFEERVQDLKPEKKAPARKTLQEIRAEAREIDKLKKTKSFGQTTGEDIRTRFDKIVALMRQLPGGDKVAPPPSIIDWNKSADHGLGKMHATVLSSNPGGHAGSQPYDESKLWKQIRRIVRPKSKHPIYVRGHLLNHHIHGAGHDRNLVPITSLANGVMERVAETLLKKAVIGENRVLDVTVETVGQVPVGRLTKFPDGSEPERQLARGITIEAKEKVDENVKSEDAGKKGPPFSLSTTIINTIPDTETEVRPE
jgi:hypothetical protein